MRKCQVYSCSHQSFFCLQILSDQLSHVCFIGSHCILYHHNGSMSSLFFRVGVFFRTMNVTFLWNCNKTWMWRSYVVKCSMWRSYVAECWMWRSYVVRETADRVLRLLYMLSFFVVWYLVRAARCWQPIVGGYLGAWIVLLDFSRRSRALHLLLWSIIWYWMSNKLTLRGEKRHVSLGNVYY